LVVGDPETVIAKLNAIEAMGVDQFVVYADWGQPQEMVMRSLELFAAEVLPHLNRSSTVANREQALAGRP
jgi:alkanesulfonate monooxygenase SsuD/methylene tetrahydromethanopterin reductase-like flavin-dependent oxidoreductase (luciferase family)